MFQRDYQLRDAVIGGDGRTVVLACVPFDREAIVDDGDGPYREVFRRGAFRKIGRTAGTADIQPEHVELQYAHAKGVPYGFGVEIREDEKYLIGAFRIAPDGGQGDRLLALVRDEQLRGVSIGYIAGTLPGDNRETLDNSGRLVERLRVKRLVEVSLTPAPAYAGAEVMAVREQAANVVDIDMARRRARAAWDLYKMSNVR